MPDISTLYYPRFEPDQRWLRSMLLFHDRVHSIVPAKAGYEPSRGMQELLKADETVFVPLAPAPDDLEYDAQSLRALRTAFERLSRTRKRKTADSGSDASRWGALIVRGGSNSMSPVDYEFSDGLEFRIHEAKMGTALLESLRWNGLARDTRDAEWWVVDRRAVDLVLSSLAGRMARNRHDLVYTSTDRVSPFTVVAHDDLETGRWQPNSSLASAILSASVPAEVAEMPVRRYIDLRKRYADARTTFRLAMDELRTLYLKPEYASAEQLAEALNLIVKDFGKEMDAARRGRGRSLVQEWSPITIGGFVSVGAAIIANPAVGIGAAGVGVTLQVIGHMGARKKRPETPVSQTQAQLIRLDRDVKWNQKRLGRVFGQE